MSDEQTDESGDTNYTRSRVHLTDRERADFGIRDRRYGLMFMESDVERILTARLRDMGDGRDCDRGNPSRPVHGLDPETAGSIIASLRARLDAVSDLADHLAGNESAPLIREALNGYVRTPSAEPEYVDCTCGHPYADHSVGVCNFKGCGCGL